LWEDSYELWVGRKGEEMIMDHVASYVNCGRIVMNFGAAGKEAILTCLVELGIPPVDKRKLRNISQDSLE
jgi:hypothetical protein